MSTAMMSAAVATVVTMPTVVIGAITTVITRTVVTVVIGRVVAGVVIRSPVDVGRTGVVVAARQSKTQYCT
ncbi:hypothetical protein D3C79_937330 [compost metagenome]